MTPHKWETRERILSAATELYRAGGARRMTMRAIGRCIGMRGSAIYKHFPSKAALLEAVAAREVRALRARAWAENRKSRPPRHLVKVFHMMVKYTREEPHLFALLRDLPSPTGHTPAMIFAGAFKALHSRGAKDFMDESCRRLWAAVVGPASHHAFGSIHDLRFQTLRSLLTVRGTAHDVWGAMTWNQWEYPQISPLRPAILGPPSAPSA